MSKIKQKNKYYIFSIIVFVMILSSCQKTGPSIETPDTTSEIPFVSDVQISPSLSPVITTEPTKAVEPASEELKALLPKDIGFTWIYNGFVEYGHEMSLDAIYDDSDKGITIYSISGTVDDPSDGEAKRDFNMSIEYMIDSETMLQVSSGEMLMDTKIEQIELIRLPLNSGAVWEQISRDLDGNKITLRCTIQEINADEGQKVYTIIYKDIDSDYFEKRTIQEGIGITSFEKLYVPKEGEPFVIGYYLYKNQE